MCSSAPLDDRLFRWMDDAHAVKDQLLAPDEPCAGTSGVQDARVDDRRRQKRRFIGTQRCGRHLEVRPCRSFGTVDTVAPLDDIEVDLEDPRLLELDFEAPGN